MAGQSSQNNTDNNTNQGGYVGEVEASLGSLDFGSSSASASSTGSSSLVIGDKMNTSGKTSTGGIGLVKMVIIAAAVIVGFSIYAKGAK